MEKKWSVILEENQGRMMSWFPSEMCTLRKSKLFTASVAGRGQTKTKNEAGFTHREIGRIVWKWRWEPGESPSSVPKRLWEGKANSNSWNECMGVSRAGKWCKHSEILTGDLVMWMLNFRGQSGRVLEVEVEVWEGIPGYDLYLLVEMRVQVMDEILGMWVLIRYNG